MDEQELIMTTSNSGSIADEMSTSTSSSTNGGSGNGGTNGCGKKVTITSPDPTPYVAKARVTRPTPPPPSYNPMQFVQIKPCNLYQTAQQQLKKAEEVKKLKEVKKEEPEEWQCNLDSWKSSRRKRVEHIIDRVVETKKLELEEHDRMRRKSKTFSEMIEERAERGGPRRAKLAALAVYNEEETNDLSDLGIGTSSASGKSSLSEDYDNNSVMSDNPADLDNKTTMGGASQQQQQQNQQHHKQHTNNMANHQQQHHHHQQQQHNSTREYVSSPGYDTSSSTAPASSPDPCEYTYEGAIQDYKARVTRAASAGKMPGVNGNGSNGVKSKESSPEHHQHHNGGNTSSTTTGYPTRRGSKIEDRLIGFEVTSPSDNQEGIEKPKVDVPKINISKRKEIFESQASIEPKGNKGGVTTPTGATTNGGGSGVVPRVVLRERFKVDTSTSNGNNSSDLPAAKKEVKRLSGDLTSIRDRMQSLEQQKNSVNASKSVDVPVPPLKERLSSLQNAVTKEDFKKPPVALVDARQLEIMKNEDERMKQQNQRQEAATKVASTPRAAGPVVEVIVESPEQDRDRDDSGIHTSSDDIELLQEQQLNAAIAALALEEKQLEEAANAVNQIEAEFAELTDRNPAPLASASPLPPASQVSVASTPAAAAATTTTSTNENTRNMEFSVSSTNKDFIPPVNPSSSCVVGSHNVVASSSRTGGDDINVNDIDNKNSVVVSGTQCNLRRKPSNEMVHHRNLLKMFKETFTNDNELVEEAENAVVEQQPPTPPIRKHTTIANPELEPSLPEEIHYLATSSQPITQVFDFTGNNNNNPQSPTSPMPILTQKPPSPVPVARTPGTPPGGTPFSMIPRSINPTGKPPMSPKSVRYNAAAKLPPQSPLSSPTPQRKPDSQFSINGRVEIFNSKQLEASNSSKPPTPTLPTKKIHLAQIPATNKPEIGLPTPTALHGVTEPRTTSTTPSSPVTAKSLPSMQSSAATAAAVAGATTVNEPGLTTSRNEIRSPTPNAATPTEVVICAPPVTIVNPDELPKPNTVKALSSCFSKDVSTPIGPSPPMPPPKPLPRSRIPQITPPQSPTPVRRNLVSFKPASLSTQNNQSKDVVDEGPVKVSFAISPYGSSSMLSPYPNEEDDTTKKHSIISNSSTNSSDYAPVELQIAAVVHTPPKESGKSELKSIIRSADPLAPNDSLKPAVTRPSNMPTLVACTPNQSGLFKLASSAPPSPVSPRPIEADVEICTRFLESQAPKNLALSKEDLEHQNLQAVEEVLCDKIDVNKRPAFDQVPYTGYQEVNEDVIKRIDGFQKAERSISNDLNSKPSDLDIALCESFLDSMAPADLKVPRPYPPAGERQKSVEEKICDKVNVHNLPPADSHLASTGFQDITTNDIKRCDGLNATPSSPKTGSKPSSPIMAARAAHSKALIDTCEKIIAEERLACSQMKSSLPGSPKSTPHMQRKSKIPKPIPCCIASSGSMNQADYVPAEGTYVKNSETPQRDETPEDENVLIARTHVVETQIKVTTTTPPASPKPNTKSQPQNTKKTKNIFDFLRRNFGHHEETPTTAAAVGGSVTTATTNATEAPLVATTKSGVDVVKIDEIHKFDNSKFYVPSEDIAPPPLPKSPAPVNIEIKKTIRTDEIVEDHNDDMALSKEINDMLDDEINKLTEIEEKKLVAMKK